MEKLIFKWTKYELAFPVGRGEQEREKFIRTAVLLLKNNESVGIYPEGRRSRSGIFSIDNVKVGAAWIAKLAGPETQVIPVFVYGTNNIIPVGKFFRLNFNVEVRAYFGKALDLTKFYDLPDTPETSEKIIRIIIQGILRQQTRCMKSILKMS